MVNNTKSFPFRRTIIAMLLAACVSAAEPTQFEWTVAGVVREALVYIPSDVSGPFPLVFVFHGAGGKARGFVNILGIHRLWPEAVVIYPQGLPVSMPGRPVEVMRPYATIYLRHSPRCPPQAPDFHMPTAAKGAMS